jgi:hypothetical protein
VNFVGHAAVACWHGRSPAFALGAMLPDFLGMSRARPRSIDDPELTRGVRLHHETDAVFHRAPAFVEICATAAGALTGEGVRRGTARAVAHLGAELFLDGALLAGDDSAPLRSLYLEAVAEGAGGSGTRGIAFRDDDAGDRFRRLVHRLAALGVPDGYRDPIFVGDRLTQALAGRRRLAITPEDDPAVRSYLPELQRRVVERVDALVGSLRAELDPSLAPGTEPGPAGHAPDASPQAGTARG